MSDNLWFRSPKLVTCDTPAFQELLSLLGGMDKEHHTPVVICPHATLEQAGWALHPNSLRELHHRCGSQPLPQPTRVVVLLLDPAHPLLADPPPVPDTPAWPQAALDQMQQAVTGLDDLIPFDPNLEAQA